MEKPASSRNSYVIRSVSYRDRRFSSSVSSAPVSSIPEGSTAPVPESQPGETSYPRLEKRNAVVSLYMSLSWMAGFREKYSLVLLVIFGGALFGFCLARSPTMDGAKMRTLTTAGEFFWFNMPLYLYNYIIHIYLTTVGGLLVGIQFIPTVRRRWVTLHRLNGYLVIGTLIVGNVSGGIISRRSFGGEINSQAAYYLLAIMTIVPLIIGYFYVKRNTRLHRKWMLRGVVYFSTVITGRLAGLAARKIISEVGSYYSLWRCDEILFVLKDLAVLTRRFPQCLVSGNSLSEPSLYVPVHASVNEGKLGLASASRVTQGMVLWVATLIHVIGVEIYIRKTDSANYQRYGFALERRDFDPDKDDLPYLKY
ncbi:hypothetical protein Moror_4950 [Moniliophthora roreri MCA 2997]|uniref:DUF2306 domain-containing protein n=1 Tax=Moniliophthora roreri (strain MCA 2997) TaxID=1381753 RepID=V2WHV7_MONRO|nr:hypothetical protein Moror_4950 [Moniliophthora roreri MCA 2997]